TTGEAATLDNTERRAIFEFVPRVAGGRIPVIAGVGTNDTRTTVLFAGDAERAGCDGLLVVTPFYNRPTQRGLTAHYRAVAERTHLPIVLYNVPARTGVDLLPETVYGLAESHPNIVSIKEASGSLERITEHLTHGAIEVLCGEDHQIADALLLGASGVIGVASNVVPRLVNELVRCCRPQGDRASAAALTATLAPLVSALFLETNPAPVKAALSLLGLCRPGVRSPLIAVEPSTHLKIERALTHCGLVFP
ncbi:MAG: 4-hydroxy-tetrahydrodipicolinate synthase, partial [Planctomycetota bacterium]